MAFVLADRVRETTTTTGTGAVTLSGAYTGFQSFSSAIGNGNNTYYTIANVAVGEWEVGIGTYTSASNTLSRTTVLASSNAGAAVSFSTGSKDVFVTQPAERAVYVDPTNTYVSVPALTTAGQITLSGGTANGVAYLNGSKVLTTGSALTFDGTTLQVGGGVGLFRLNASTSDYSLMKMAVAGTNYGSFGVGTGGEVVWNANSLHLWNVNSSEGMRLTSTGLGIGTSSPGAKLDVAGGIKSNASVSITKAGSDTIASGPFFYLTSGGAGDGWVTQLGASNTYDWWRNSGGTWAKLATLDSAGNLGIGVTPSAWNSSAKALQVGSTTALFNAFNGTYFRNNAYYGASGDVYLISAAATQYAQTSGQHQWFTAPSGTAGAAITFTQAMTLDASGNLVIGQTLAGARVTAKGDNSLQFFNAANTNQTDIGFPDAQTFNIRTYHASGSSISFGTNAQYGSTTERARIDPNGSWLVGTTTAGNYKSRTIGAVRALQIQNTENDNTDKYGLIAAGQNASGSNPNGFTLVGGAAQSGVNSVYIGGGFSETNAATAVVFFTAANATTASGTERARIDSSGNLLVGTTSRGHTGGATSFDLDKTDGALYVNHATGTPTGYYFASFGYNTSSIGSITQNGTTGVLYNLTSDYRLKNNPTPVTGAKEFVMALQPKTWDWWDGSGKGVGFIAHEFMEVAKYSGNGEKDAVDEDGNPVYQSIQPSSSEVMANLVALIQEQQAIIQQLQADVAALKGN